MNNTGIHTYIKHKWWFEITSRLVVDNERVKLVASELKKIEHVISQLLTRDPQYTAVKNLLGSLVSSWTALLVVSNALISYQLSMPGEEYWTVFSRYFSKPSSEPLPSRFERFLVETHCTRSLDQKIKRIRVFTSSKLAEKLVANPLQYCSRVKDLVDELSRTLGVDRDSKTIVFAAKMYGYYCIASGLTPDFTGISIPVDYRNALLALTSCIVSNCSNVDLHKCAKELTSSSYSRVVRNAWNTVCTITQIPCLLLDVFTWLFTGIAVENSFNPEKTVETLLTKHGVSIPLETARILLECAGRYVQHH